MKQFFILLILVLALLSSCKELNDDFPVREPDVFFYKTDNISPRDISCMVYNNDHDVFLGSKNKDEVLHLGIHGWEVISIQNPQNINPGINCILYDDMNRLWIGTDHGLFRFDNNKIERVQGFESRKINCLGRTRLYEVWVGMNAKENERNIVRINKDDSFYYLQSDSEFEKLNVTSMAIVNPEYGYIGTNSPWVYYFYNAFNISCNEYLQDDDIITCGWVMNADNICLGSKFSDLLYSGIWSTFERIKVTNNSAINAVCYSSDTAIWMATAGSGLLRFKNSNFTAFDKISAKIASDTILSVVPADEKHILCSIPGGKVYLMPINQ